MKLEDLEVGRWYEHRYHGRAKLVAIDAHRNQVRMLRDNWDFTSSPESIVRTWAERERHRREFQRRRDALLEIAKDLEAALRECEIDAELRSCSAGKPEARQRAIPEKHYILVELDHMNGRLLAAALLRAADRGGSGSAALISALDLDG